MTISNGEGQQDHSERVAYLDLLRVLAIVGVITIHTSTSVCAWNTQGMSSYEFTVNNVAEVLSHWSVPVFVMISGSLMLSPHRDVTVRSIWSRNIARIVSAFVFWSFLYALIAFVSPSFFPEMLRLSLHDMLRSVVKGEFHLWYCWLIIGLYAATPLVRVFCADDVLVPYYLLTSFVLQMLPRLFMAFGLFTDVLSYIVENLHADIFMGYLFYYILGHYLAEHETNVSNVVLVFLLMAASAFNIQANWMASEGGAHPVSTFWSNLLPTVALQAACLFLLLKHNVRKEGHPLLECLGRSTFGIYLVHIVPLRVLGRLALLRPFSNLWADLVLMVVVVFLVSLAATLILRRIPFIRRFV